MCKVNKAILCIICYSVGSGKGVLPSSVCVGLPLENDKSTVAMFAPKLATPTTGAILITPTVSSTDIRFISPISSTVQVSTSYSRLESSKMALQSQLDQSKKKVHAMNTLSTSVKKTIAYHNSRKRVYMWVAPAPVLVYFELICV